jgi:hypothetical protein
MYLPFYFKFSFFKPVIFTFVVFKNENLIIIKKKEKWIFQSRLIKYLKIWKDFPVIEIDVIMNVRDVAE